MCQTSDFDALCFWCRVSTGVPKMALVCSSDVESAVCRLQNLLRESKYSFPEFTRTPILDGKTMLSSRFSQQNPSIDSCCHGVHPLLLPSSRACGACWWKSLQGQSCGRQPSRAKELCRQVCSKVGLKGIERDIRCTKKENRPGCGSKWKTDVGPQMWMSSLVLTIQLLGYLILTHTHLSTS